MFAYDRSPVCLACAWVLVQAGRTGVGLCADVKIVSPVLSRAESRCGADRGSFSDMNLSHCCPGLLAENKSHNKFLVIH